MTNTMPGPVTDNMPHVVKADNARPAVENETFRYNLPRLGGNRTASLRT